MADPLVQLRVAKAEAEARLTVERRMRPAAGAETLWAPVPADRPRMRPWTHLLGRQLVQPMPKPIARSSMPAVRPLFTTYLATYRIARPDTEIPAAKRRGMLQGAPSRRAPSQLARRRGLRKPAKNINSVFLRNARSMERLRTTPLARMATNARQAHATWETSRGVVRAKRRGNLAIPARPFFAPAKMD